MQCSLFHDATKITEIYAKHLQHKVSLKLGLSYRTVLLQIPGIYGTHIQIDTYMINYRGCLHSVAS